VTPGGETWDELAKKLGTGFTGLRHARMRGRLRARYVKNLGGRWGAPVPILASDDLLDPGARGWIAPDPIWGVSTCDLLERVPGDFSAELMRVPLYRSHARKGEFEDSLHPEVRNSPRVQKRERLAPPPPDYVWYKWSKAGEFLGENPKYWRKSAEDPGKPPPPGAGMKKKYKRKPKPRVGGGSQHFIGWAWVCPRCGKSCRTLYLPMQRQIQCAAVHSAAEIRIPKHEIRNNSKARGEMSETPGLEFSAFEILNLFRISSFGFRASDTGFACYRCSRIRSFSRIDAKNSWNELVGYLSGGMMYGREVPMPADFALPATRKRQYRPRLVKPRRQEAKKWRVLSQAAFDAPADAQRGQMREADATVRLS
jgi:hypothetical protein